MLNMEQKHDSSGNVQKEITTEVETKSQPNVLVLGELDNLPAALQELTHEDADLAAELLNKSFKSGKVKLKSSHHRICIYKTEKK